MGAIINIIKVNLSSCCDALFNFLSCWSRVSRQHEVLLSKVRLGSNGVVRFQTQITCERDRFKISLFCTEGEAVALIVVAGSIRVSLAILYAWPYLFVALKVKPYLLVALKVKYQVE